jgi:PAS domain S-box-containing protein
LASIVASCEDAIFSKNLDGTILSWNASAEKLFGYTAEEILGQPASLLLPPEHLDEFPQILERIRAGARLEHYEVTRMRRDGRRVELSMTVSPITDSVGALVGNSTIARDMTERKQAETALRESRQRYKEVFDITSECIFLIDVTTDGRFKFAGFNPAEEKAVGFSSAEVAGRFIEEVLSEQAANGVIAHYRHCLELGTVISYEEELALPIGRRYFHTNLIPVRDATGRISRIVGMARDITGYKRAEEALRMSQQRLELSQEAGGIGTWDWDIVTNQKHCSKEYWRLYGLPKGDLAPPPEEWLQLVHPEDRARIGKELNRALDGIGHYNTEFRVVWPDGTVHWLFGKGEVFRDFNGKPIRMLGVNMDISERKYADQALRESEERFRRVFEEGPLGLALVGKDYRFAKVNSALCQMVGYSEPELLQMSFTDITHADDLQADLELAERLFRREIPFFRIQKRYVKKDGEIIWINLTASMIHGPGGEPLHGLAMIENITESKRTQEEALDRQKLESVGTLAGGIAHDFNNLLGGVHAQAELARIAQGFGLETRSGDRRSCPESSGNRC